MAGESVHICSSCTLWLLSVYVHESNVCEICFKMY